MLAKPFGRHKLAPRFTSHVKEHRESLALSVEVLAEYCNVSTETIEQIESARYEPSVVLAQHIAARLGTNVETLFGVNAPAEIRSPEQEERIRFQTYRVGHWAFFLSFTLSLLGANVCLQISGYQSEGFALGALWLVIVVSYLIMMTRVKGYWRTQRRVNTAHTSRSKQVLQASLQGVGFAMIMFFWDKVSPTPEHHTIVDFLVQAIIFGVAMFLFRFGLGRKK